MWDAVDTAAQRQCRAQPQRLLSLGPCKIGEMMIAPMIPCHVWSLMSGGRGGSHFIMSRALENRPPPPAGPQTPPLLSASPKSENASAGLWINMSPPSPPPAAPKQPSLFQSHFLTLPEGNQDPCTCIRDFLHFSFKPGVLVSDSVFAGSHTSLWDCELYKEGSGLFPVPHACHSTVNMSVG